MDLFEKMKDEVNRMKEGMGIPISISSTMLNELLEKSDKIKNTTVEIAEKEVQISGKAEVKKWFINRDIPFSLTLQPIKMEKRQLIFKITHFKPVNINFLNKMIFTKSPYLLYDHHHINLDFNNIDLVKKIPIGNIKKYELEEGKILLTIGI
ncbi:hypothetical protein [Bacillus sp. 2205SS5-2]|uniref:hypothetical protein n=1 Tax=Bacillus sp. 2205SS5-2 TaxID=3109031 RepID=UPI003006DC99